MPPAARLLQRARHQGSEVDGLHETHDAKFAALGSILAVEHDAGRADDAEMLLQRLVDVVVRGDIGLLKSGLDWLEARTGKPVLGVLPYLHGLMLDAEDAIATASQAKSSTRLKAVAIAYPRCSNHNDLDPLRLHPEVAFSWLAPGDSLPPCDLIILPGSKAVQADLAWLREHGHDVAIQRHLRYGGKVIGLCGGYQMLGEAIHDPLGLEGKAGSTPGLGLLAVDTTLEREKQLRNVSGHLLLEGDPAMTGYEIHLGVTQGAGAQRPVVKLDEGRVDGAISPDDQVLGTYCHGVFDHPAALTALLQWAGAQAVARVDFAARREADINRLADSVEAAFNWEKLRPYLAAI